MLLLMLSKLFRKNRVDTEVQQIAKHNELLDAEIALQESERALARAKATVEFNKHMVARLHRLHDAT